MKILVCNDDGIFSKGILQLASSMSEIGETTVVAPDDERSATGHAITLHKPLRIKPVNLPELNIRAFAVDGTPADCVKIGYDIVMERDVDLVISGINRGPNLGTDVLYSGTVSAAFEGAILGLPSIAVSLVSYDSDDYVFAGKVAVKIAEKLMEHGLPSGAILNINVPAVPEKEIKGIKTARLGVRRYAENYIKRLDPRGKPYYWLTGEAIDDDMANGDGMDTDITAVANNYVAVTPIHFDLTLHSYIENVNKWFQHSNKIDI